MKFTGLLLAITSLLTGSLHAKETINYDRHEKHRGVSLQTGKEGLHRNYRAYTKTILPYSVSVVRKSITNYTDHCNNAFKLKREYSDKNSTCKYHNENMIESVVVKNLKPGWTPVEGEVERFVVGRRVYNRGLYGYYEMVHISEGKNKAGQKVHIINQRMLSDNESKAVINPEFQKDSSFSDSTIRFLLTEIAPNQTELKYIYEASTAHWILNKELSVAQVFSSITKSVNELVKSVATEAHVQTRAIASEE